jgi:hypothetical protein
MHSKSTFYVKNCSVNLKLGQSDVTSPTNFMCLLHRVCIFQLYLEFVWRNSIFLVKSLLIYDSRSILKCTHGTFVTFIQENGVPRGKLQLLGFFHYNFWHKMFLQFLNQHSMTSKTMSQIFPVMFQSLLKPHYVYTAWLHKISPNLIVAHLWLLLGYQEENYNFWDFSTTIFLYKMSTLNEISSCIGTPRSLVLVYVVLRPIICKIVSRISDRINRTNSTHN